MASELIASSSLAVLESEDRVEGNNYSNYLQGAVGDDFLIGLAARIGLMAGVRMIRFLAARVMTCSMAALGQMSLFSQNLGKNMNFFRIQTDPSGSRTFRHQTMKVWIHFLTSNTFFSAIKLVKKRPFR